ncbi:MAG: hypothetical protein KDA22_09660 [Phycisphaerales bacterium]|nr:hypothetical protein [Phycisphaerales bacterium]
MNRRRIASLRTLALLLVGCQTPPTAPTAASPPPSRAPVPSPEPAPSPELSPGSAIATAESRPAAPDLKGAETFDAAWTIVRDTYFDASMNGVDWNAVRTELRPQAEAAETTEEVRDAVNAMVARLGASHFGVLPSQAASLVRGSGADHEHAPLAEDTRGTAAPPTSDETGAADSRPSPAGASEIPSAFSESPSTPGSIDLDVRLINGRVLVTRVGPSAVSEIAPIRTGWAIASVGDHSTAALQASLAEQSPAYARFATASTVRRWLEGPAGSVEHIVFEDGDGRERVANAIRTAEEGTKVAFGALPEMNAVLEAREATTEELRAAAPASGDDRLRIGLIRFNIWMVPVATPFHEAIDDYRGADAIIIDLRGNPGGIGAMAMGLAGHFCDRPVSLGAFRTRDATLEFRVNPRRVTAKGVLAAPFARPVAILVDDLTASTSEIFAGGLQAIGRARIFGTTTAGAALPAHMSTLPNGDALLHAVADFTLPNGVRIEGRGVVPDEVVEVTRQDLLGGRDAPLLAALRWAAEEAALARNAAGTAPAAASSL